MPEAPRARPEIHEVLHTLRGHVKARPKAVYEALEPRIRPVGDYESMYTSDPIAFLVIEQGGWWYRGEYRIVPDESGSNVEYTLVNVALTGRRIGRFTGRRVIADAPATFERMLKELRLELE